MQPKYNLIEFKFGNLKKKFSYYLKVSILLKTSIELLSYIPGLDERKVFNVIDIVQKRLANNSLNDFIIKDYELLSYRIDRVLDDAIKKAQKI